MRTLLILISLGATIGLLFEHLSPLIGKSEHWAFWVGNTVAFAAGAIVYPALRRP